MILALLISSLASANPLSSLKLLSEVKELSTKAIDLGKFAKGKLKTPGLVSFNERMIEDHQVSSNTLKEVTSSLSLPSTEEDKETSVVSKLKNLSGDKFEKQYITESLQLNSSLLDLLKNKVLPVTENAAVKGLLKNYIPRVSTLVDSLQVLKKQEE